MNDQEQQLNMLALAMILLQQLSQAAELGDLQSAAIMQEVQLRAQAMMQQTQMAKRGTKLVKKASCGCKHLKRVGGKVVTVDCNGNVLK